MKNEKIIRVAQDGSGDYIRLVDAFEHVRLNNLHDMTISIASGIYDVMQEVIDVKGQEFVDNFTWHEYASPTGFKGLFLGNNLTVIGDNVCDTVINCFYTGNNESFMSDFSVFHVYDNAFNLQNVTINGKDVRYCLHDDSRTLNEHGKCMGYVTNCVMNDMGLHYGACLAGGIIGNTWRKISDCQFYCQPGHYAVYYHTNEGSGDGMIRIENIYSETGTTYLGVDHGTIENQSVMFVSNCHLSAEPFKAPCDGTRWPDNATLKYWNCDF